MHSAEGRLGALLVAGGCLPFAAGALVAPPGEAGLGGLPCPFRAATGLPCPLCGASRAFSLAVRGDAGWLRYNAPWVALAALAVLAGVLGIAAAVAGSAPLGALRGRVAAALSSPPRVVGAILLALAVPWAYALAQRGTIV